MLAAQQEIVRYENRWGWTRQRKRIMVEIKSDRLHVQVKLSWSRAVKSWAVYRRSQSQLDGADAVRENVMPPDAGIAQSEAT